MYNIKNDLEDPFIIDTKYCMYIQNFLNDGFVNRVYNELTEIKDWYYFHRNNTKMCEYYDYEHMTYTNHLFNQFRSKSFIRWLEQTLNIKGLLFDPIGTGEGISKLSIGNCIDKHIDFNWNERIKLNRVYNMLFYIGENVGGDLEFYENNTKTSTINTKNNTLVIFRHSEKFSHGVSKVVTGDRFALRMFFYKSNDRPLINPHQSLYYYKDTKFYNPEKQMKSYNVEIRR